MRQPCEWWTWKLSRKPFKCNCDYSCKLTSHRCKNTPRSRMRLHQRYWNLQGMMCTLCHRRDPCNFLSRIPWSANMYLLELYRTWQQSICFSALFQQTNLTTVTQFASSGDGWQVWQKGTELPFIAQTFRDIGRRKSGSVRIFRARRAIPRLISIESLPTWQRTTTSASISCIQVSLKFGGTLRSERGIMVWTLLRKSDHENFYEIGSKQTFSHTQSDA